MNFFEIPLNKNKEKLSKLKRELLDLEEKIISIEDINYFVNKFGIVCDFLPPSLEDWTHFEHLFNPYLNGYCINPIVVNYDRRCVGFSELNEYDHMTGFILPRWYEFK
jgi:hypothetical protein